jgi:cell division protein FtsQ
MQRIWLRPVVRRVLRAGIPVFLVVFLVTSYIANPKRQQVIGDRFDEIRASIEERPEFTVKLMAIDGAGQRLAREIRDSLPYKFPLSAFDLDLEQARNVVAAIDAVEEITLRVRTGGVLQVTVVEREPVVVWRSLDGIVSLDAGGHRVDILQARAQRNDLPLITGKGADAHVDEALEILAAAEPVKDRLRGLVRMGERRWDVILDREQRILLPEVMPVKALERVIALNGAQDMLGRDLIRVDMRNELRPTIRVASRALDALRRIKGRKTGE